MIRKMMTRKLIVLSIAPLMSTFSETSKDTIYNHSRLEDRMKGLNCKNSLQVPGRGAVLIHMVGGGKFPFYRKWLFRWSLSQPQWRHLRPSAPQLAMDMGLRDVSLAFVSWALRAEEQSTHVLPSSVPHPDAWQKRKPQALWNHAETHLRAKEKAETAQALKILQTRPARSPWAFGWDRTKFPSLLKSLSSQVPVADRWCLRPGTNASSIIY